MAVVQVGRERRLEEVYKLQGVGTVSGTECSGLGYHRDEIARDSRHQPAYLLEGLRRARPIQGVVVKHELPARPSARWERREGVVWIVSIVAGPSMSVGSSLVDRVHVRHLDRFFPIWKALCVRNKLGCFCSVCPALGLTPAFWFAFSMVFLCFDVCSGSTYWSSLGACTFIKCPCWCPLSTATIKESRCFNFGRRGEPGEPGESGGDLGAGGGLPTLPSVLESL